MMADNSEAPSWQPQHLNAAARLQSLRDLLNSDRHNGIDQQRALDAIDQEMSERSVIGSLVNLERRRRDLDTHMQSHESMMMQEALPTNDHHLTPAARLRRRISTHHSRLSRMRGNQNDSLRSDSHEGLTTPRRPTPPLTYHESGSDHYPPAYQSNREQRFRVKRRKLDDGTFDDDSKIISYGDKGRVTPGPLRLEIINCDGEEFEEPIRGTSQFVLHDDATVYNTKSNRCNLLLKHVGGMPFALTKLVFKAPQEGYDAPAQEGLIFIAMDDEKLLEKTAQHETRYSSKGYRNHHGRRHDIYRPSQEYMNSTRSPLRLIDRSRYVRDPYAHHLWFGESSPELDIALVPGFEVSLADGFDSEETTPSSPRSPRPWHTDVNNQSRRSFIDRYRQARADHLNYAELSATSEESDDEDLTLRQPHAASEPGLNLVAAQQRQLLDLMRRSHDRDDPSWQGSSDPHRAPDDWQDLQRFMNSRRSTPSAADWRSSGLSERNGHPTVPQGSMSGTKALTDSASATISRQLSSDTLAPHARFFVHRHKSVIAINFEPAVSGRYILIKLWAACPNANIDIQCITAHGYGGPRFFPATDLR